ncbi:glycosyltransferase [Sporosarcina luteola]|uniref:glycosyltransferase n=1 Tax=Sporosarcina luteola TaxID=582850 RepID=UPI00203A7306|nr:glycosyltransferase [Sporosarcina luteola]MCM3743942.1 glycosyltransferase [Sporosarcina luteola]
MRQLTVFSNMYPSHKHPTFGIFVKNQVEHLRSKGLKVNVVAIDNPSKGKAALKKYFTWFVKAMVHMLTKKSEVSLTHSHYTFPTGLLSFIGKKIFGLPYVITVHGGDIDKMAAKNKMIESITRFTLQNADAVIVVGERLKLDVVERFGVKEKHVHVMSMGVNTEVFKPIPKVDARTELGLPLDKKIVLFVGNMIQAKGILDLIEAFKMVEEDHPDAVLHMIGSSKDEGFMQKLEEHLSEMKINASHQEPLPQMEVAKWIAAADVFVLPSHHEGFGLVALEAMAVGTTVVGTDVGGLSFLLGNEAGILVEPHNPASLANGLKQALEQPSEDRKKIAEEIVAEHTYDVITERLVEIYSAVSKEGKK